MKIIVTILGLLTTVSVHAAGVTTGSPDDSADTLTTVVSFNGVLEKLVLNQKDRSFSLGDIEFKDVDVVPGYIKNAMYVGDAKANRIGIKFEKIVRVGLIVQGKDGKSTDFQCPGGSQPGEVNARIYVSLIDGSNNATTLNDNCLFLKKEGLSQRRK
jgi:hypothetical protein